MSFSTTLANMEPETKIKLYITKVSNVEKIFNSVNKIIALKLIAAIAVAKNC